MKKQTQMTEKSKRRKDEKNYVMVENQTPKFERIISHTPICARMGFQLFLKNGTTSPKDGKT